MPSSPESLTDIFNRVNTDKNESFHNYCRQYEDLLRQYRDKPIAVLEIGVFNGGSLELWNAVFPNATKVVGLDINARCKIYENKDAGAYVDIGDATNKPFIDHMSERHGTFDLIIDDGSHRNDHVIKSFELLFPRLNDGGLYIVEDTITYKNKAVSQAQYPNQLDYFAKFVPFLNQWRRDSDEGIKDHCVDPFKIMKKTRDVFEQSIDKLEFGCSYIAIHKKVRHHWIP